MPIVKEMVVAFTFLNHKLDPKLDNETLLAARKEIAAMHKIVEIQMIYSGVTPTSNIKELATARKELFEIWMAALTPFETDIADFSYDCMAEIEGLCTELLGREALGLEYELLAAQ